MTENYLQLTPNCPQQAGLAIHEMAIRVLSPAIPKAAINLLVAHLQQKELRVDYTRVSAWCQGHFLGNRQMTIEQFQELVNIFWQRPGGLGTVPEILALARCVGKLVSGQQTFELVNNLGYEWLLSFGSPPVRPFENFHIPDDRYPRGSWLLPRAGMVAKLTDRLPEAGLSNQPILISGQPGTGKSRLLSQLADSPWGHPFEKTRLIYLNGGGIEAYLRTWHQEIYGCSPPLGLRVEELTHLIRQREKTTRQLVLVDAVSHLRFIQPILEIFKDTRSVVILTTYRGLGLPGLQTDNRFRLTLSGFTLAEALELYEKNGSGLKAEDRLAFTALHKTLKGNPLALHYAFQNVESEGLTRLVHLLNSTDVDIPQEMLTEIFLSLQVSFERLTPGLQSAFARLGAMPRFHGIEPEALAALWANSSAEMDLEKTGLLVNQLQVSISPFEPACGYACQWRLHEQTHLFAKCKLAETSQCEQVLARQWFARVTQSGHLIMPDTSLREATLIHLAARLHSHRSGQGNPKKLVRLFHLLLFGIDPGREMIEQNIQRLTSYEYFVAQTLDQKAQMRRKWFSLWQIDLLAVLALNLLFSKNRWAGLLEGFLMLVFISVYSYLCLSMTKSTSLWTLLWKKVSTRDSSAL